MNNDVFSKTWAFSEAFIPKAKAIIAQWMFEEDEYKDKKEATDLSYDSLFAFNDGLSVRIRKHKAKYFEIDKERFTLRKHGKSGNPDYSEIHKVLTPNKIVSKYGFYAILCPNMRDILWYTIFDMRILKQFMIDNKSTMDTNRRKISNGDGSAFKTYRWSEFPPEMIMEQGYNTTVDKFKTARRAYLKQHEPELWKKELAYINRYKDFNK